MKYTYFGQSSFLLETETNKFLFDPFISQNPLAEAINLRKIIGVHYDTFPAIEIDSKVAVESFKRAQKTLLLPVIGETIVL